MLNYDVKERYLYQNFGKFMYTHYPCLGRAGAAKPWVSTLDVSSYIVAAVSIYIMSIIQGNGRNYIDW